MEDEDGVVLELAEVTADEGRPSDGVEINSSSPSAVVPSQRRCQIVRTDTTKSATTTEAADGPKNADVVKSTKFVPRPEVPTLSKAELLLIRAEDISIRGNPCINRRSAEHETQTSVLFYSVLICFRST